MSFFSVCVSSFLPSTFNTCVLLLSLSTPSLFKTLMIPRPSYRVSLALSFLAALIVANVSGPQYIYPTFGTSLNDRFNWSAVQNSFVSTACFVGVSFSGPLCAWMIETLRIKKTLQVSALLMFLGPFLVAQTYAGRLPDSFILCAFYLICTGIAGAAAYLCALDSQVCRR